MEPEHLLQPVGLGHQCLDVVLHILIAIAIASVAATKPLRGAPTSILHMCGCERPYPWPP